jgi:hypothetical protein
MSAWPSTVEELVRAQEQLAEEAPPSFEPAGELAFGGCFICFERGSANGPGQKGDRGWAGAALLRSANATRHAAACGARGLAHRSRDRGRARGRNGCRRPNA